jgi:hypothetical protein
MKPRIFIASSSESRQVAGALQQNLDHVAEVTVWSHDVFQPGEFGLESLIDRLDRAQFAVFVLTGDDQAIVRGKEVSITRDNVLFELGLFMGRLGRERCFVLTPASLSVHIMSDIAGLTRVVFNPKRDDGVLVAATATAAEQIMRAIQRRTSELRPKAAETVHQILEVAARLIALRSGLNENEVRGFLHLYNEDEKCLVPVESYAGKRFHDDAGIHIPCEREKCDEWYIIARAFCGNQYECAEVDWKADLTKVPYGRAVWRDLKSVVAHPVRPHARPNRSDTAPIGTIAFDSSMPLTSLGWKTDSDLEDIVKLLAGNIFTIVTRVY